MVVTLPKKAAQVVYSTAVWTAAFVWMGGVWCTWALVSRVLPVHKSQMYIGSPGMATVLRLTLSKVEVIYDPDFDPERRSVFCQNHVSMLDAHAACAAIPHPFCGMMNAWQFRIPFYGWMMRLVQSIPVEKGSGRFRGIAEAARDRASRDISILAFPEAHRTLDGTVREFKRGVFWMAREAGLPVVPLATRGLFDLMPKGSLLLKPGRITIYVGPQIDTAGLSNPQLQDVIARTQRIVADFAERGIMPGRARPPTAAPPTAQSP